MMTAAAERYILHVVIIVVVAAAVFYNDHYYNIYKTDYYVTFTVLMDERYYYYYYYYCCGVRRSKSINRWTARAALIIRIYFIRTDGNYVFINTFKMEMGQEENRICKSAQMALMEMLFLLA